MLSFFKKNKQKPALLSPLTGTAMPVSEAPDPVFADKILGDGVAIEPMLGKVVSPANGTIAQIAHSLHAVGIETDDGLEVLVHLGIDTVKLDGEGFTCHVAVGDKVTAGQHILDMDLALIREKGFSTVSPCIVTSMDAVEEFQCQTGPVTLGESVVIQYRNK